MSKGSNDSQMNPFLREGGDEAPRPLGVGDFGEEQGGTFEALAADAPKKKLRSSTIILIAVVALAAGGLWSMRSLSRAAAGITGDKKLEATIEGFLSQLTGDASKPKENPFQVIRAEDEEKALTALTDDRTERQVALDEVKKNPFVLHTDPKPEVAPTTVEVKDDSAERLAAARKQATEKFDRAGTQLRVLMILAGRTPMANISGRVVQAGDRIPVERMGVEFTVVEVGTQSVTIRATDSDISFSHDIVLPLMRN